MEANGVDVAEKVSASKKLGENDAKKLIRDASKVHVAKGKKLDTFDGGTAKKEIVEKMLGSTGNLRAPTIKVGKTLLVGFNEDVYDQVMG
jgi:arsenate reductase-like glutaredoxin family protein